MKLSASATAVTLVGTTTLVIACDRRDAEPSRDEASAVQVSEVRAGDLSEKVRGIGELRALKTVELRAEASGTVREVSFEEGTEVERDQLLFQLEDEEARSRLEARRASLRAAEATLREVRLRYERRKAVLDTGAVSREEYHEARAAYYRAQAEIERLKEEVLVAEEALRETHVYAPFTGQVSARLVDPGDFVDVGDPLATLYRSDAMEVAFSLPERLVGHVQVGQRVRVIPAGDPDRAFEADVTFVGPSVSETARDLLVKALVENEGGELRPGMSIEAEVTLETHRDRPIVPEEALVASRRGYFVFVVRDGTAHSQDVKIGLREPGIVEVREGLEVGEQVVREGHMRLSDGSPVEVTSTAPIQAGEPP